MYKAFYHLTRNPFEITPDPTFLFPTKKHNEALVAIYYGVRRHRGFVVMTGEVGTGKTLLVRCLLKLLKCGKDSYAYIFNSKLSSLEFLQYMAGDLGLKTTSSNKSTLLLDLGSFLIARHEKKLTTVLVVDEAHHLSAEVLEEIRLLTNLETAQEKLLQILLVGQPELDEKLDSFELRQLKQRIALRCRLEPLCQEEIRGYIERRLQRAGANSHASGLFPGDAIAAIYRHSGGIPRLINTVCENALIAAYARQARSVTPDIVDEVAADFRLGAPHPVKVEAEPGPDKTEVWQAVKTLLELRDHLHRV
jgi:general secretion pathway protein A